MDRRTSGETNSHIHQLDKLRSFLFGELGNLGFTMSLVAQKSSRQTREIIGLVI